MGHICTYPPLEDPSYQSQAETSLELSQPAGEPSTNGNLQHVRQRPNVSSFGTSKMSLPQIGYERPYIVFDTIEVDSDQPPRGEGSQDRMADRDGTSTPGDDHPAGGANLPQYQSNRKNNTTGDGLQRNIFPRGIS